MTMLLLLALTAGLIILNTATLRQSLLTRHVLDWFARAVPPLSAMERAAMESGTNGFEAELFSGRPEYNAVADLLTAGLSDAERAFLDRQVDTLCAMLDDWQIGRDRDLPAQVWSYLKAERFFGLVIPEEYGGLGFSHAAHAAVVTALATRSANAAVTVMVPNALGPAQLVLAYGTPEQKSRLLPRLASGADIPCFALTGPWAGPDAAAIADTGVVVREVFEGRETLGFRVSWSKRYITLSPVATVIGLAFRVLDPHRLLGECAEPGITCALVPATQPGIQIGRRHVPLNAAFMNGPVWGENVFVPLDWVIGGAAQVGRGWTMLMDCLGTGRGISLASMGIASQMLTLRTVSAYAALRVQFGRPIGQFEGVAEPLGRIAARLYSQDGARRLAYHEMDRGARPSVASALLKVHLTEGAREAVNAGMDILGGKGICLGPRNFLAGLYQMLPISITVEGTNILSRNLIIFGQGAVRCHPYLAREMAACAARDLGAFDAALCEHAAHTAGNALRSLGILPVSELPAHDERMSTLWSDLHRLSARFALSADWALLVLGGRLLQQELQSARLGDVLSHLYFAAGALLRWEGEGRREDELELARLAAQSELHAGYLALDAFYRNAAWPLAAARLLAMPTGIAVPAPADQRWLNVARLMLQPSSARAYLTASVYLPDTLSSSEPVAQLERALECSAELQDVDAYLAHFTEAPQEERAAYLAGLPAEKARLWREREALIADLVAVDDFAAEELRPPGTLRGRILAATIEHPLRTVARA